ncbi:hypothetical protein FUAX_15880 [Fulvitalea axinellae]|uniref:Uncharacterized protein n=1 Tax=Fulvitalea axinellae TaxID=1182444 RepID=A0AAU9CAH1_9BACT|nr:hypothetical protein FUAX_15880 [Fulvitalea axinellae]
MIGLELTYDEKCRCAEDEFCYFIQHVDHFTEEERNAIRRHILEKRITGALYVSSILAGWSVVAAWVDALLLPGVAIYSIFTGEFSWQVLAPVLGFWLANATLKFIYVRISLRQTINVWKSFLSILPYAGSLVLMADYLKDEPLLRKAVLLFIKNRRKMVVRRVKGFFRAGN